MAEKDMTEKKLEDFNDVFSDIVNVLLFNGQELVDEKDLAQANTMSIYKADDKLHEQDRDVSKYWQNGTIKIAMLGIENQTKSEAKMPLRVISYDGAAYRAQLLPTDDDSLQECYPVVTLVLYFGYEHHWNKPLNLLDCLNIPEPLKPYVNDYRINLFEIAWLSDEQVAMFKSDFRMVADYFVQMRKNRNYIPSKETIKHVHEFLQLMSVMTGDNRYEEVYNNSERRPTNMCEVLEAAINQGLERGLEQGLEQGLLQGQLKTALNTLQRHVRRQLPITDQVIADIAEDNNISVEKVRSLAKENNIVLPC